MGSLMMTLTMAKECCSCPFRCRQWARDEQASFNENKCVLHTGPNVLAEKPIEYKFFKREKNL